MINAGDMPPLPLATSLEARDILTEVGMATTFRGKKFFDGYCFNLGLPGILPEVAEHLPDVDSSLNNVSYSVDVEQLIHTKTGKPVAGGILASVHFRQAEELDPDLSLVTTVRYNVMGLPGYQFALERLVVEHEQGSHLSTAKVVRDAPYPKDMAEDRAPKIPRPLATVRDEERQLGLLEVTSSEAQAIMGFFRDLNRPTRLMLGYAA